ncbi:hypothetical protein [Microvirga zambiensis]|uniref:hypothetical protein n=1 Tax=Microvirga zambiensis TaxID=1402137 RepID=UPI00191FE199|nr:hypothetical protein [Microvirga zambiensis]
MIAALFSSALLGTAEAPSKLSRLMSALIESRAKSAARELRRHEAMMADLGRRQDHSTRFIEQSEPLPFKI